MSKNLIKITSPALKKLKNIVKANNAEGIFFYLKSGGCNGFEYKFKPINEFSNKKNVQIEKNLRIEVCDKSLMYLLGTEIDWENDIMGESFKFDNPTAKNSCGCGSSFNIF